MTIPTDDTGFLSPVSNQDVAKSSQSAGQKVLSIIEHYGLFIVLVVAFVGFSIGSPAIFPTIENLRAMLSSDEVIVFLAVGVLLTLRLGDLDLSFASVMGTSGIIVGVLSVSDHWNILLASFAGIGFGLLCGAINALLVVFFGLDSFVATLGMMTVIGGLGYGISSSTVITGISSSLTSLVISGPGGLSMGVIYGWILAVVIYLLCQFTLFGRYLFVIGGNIMASLAMGLPVRRVRTIAYVVSGGIFGLAGVLLVGSLGSADPTISTQFLLPPLAGAFLGTTVFQLGTFNVPGTLTGIYLLTVMSTGIQLLGASAWVGTVFDGFALIGAIGFARLARKSTGLTGGVVKR